MSTRKNEIQMECDNHDHEAVKTSSRHHNAKTPQEHDKGKWTVKAEWAALAVGARTLASFGEKELGDIIDRLNRDGSRHEIALNFLRDEHIFISPPQIRVSRKHEDFDRKNLIDQDEFIFKHSPAEAVAVMQALKIWEYESDHGAHHRPNPRDPQDRCQVPNCHVGHSDRCPNALYDSRLGRICGAHFQASLLLDVFDLSDEEWLGFEANTRSNRLFQAWGPKWLRDLIWKLNGCMECFCPRSLNPTGKYASDPFNDYLVICETCQKDRKDVIKSLPRGFSAANGDVYKCPGLCSCGSRVMYPSSHPPIRDSQKRCVILMLEDAYPMCYKCAAQRCDLPAMEWIRAQVQWYRMMVLEDDTLSMDEIQNSIIRAAFHINCFPPLAWALFVAALYAVTAGDSAIGKQRFQEARTACCRLLDFYWEANGCN